LRRFATHSVASLKQCEPSQEVFLGGMLTLVRSFNTKKARNGNSRYVRFKLEDFSGTLECVMWPDDLARHKDEVRDDAVCFVKGVVDRTRNEPELILNRILSMEQAQRELARGLYLLFRVGVHGPQHVEALAPILGRAPGRCPVFLTVRDRSGNNAVLRLGQEFAVNPAAYPHDDLEALLGEGCVKLA